MIDKPDFLYKGKAQLCIMKTSTTLLRRGFLACYCACAWLGVLFSFSYHFLIWNQPVANQKGEAGVDEQRWREGDDGTTRWRIDSTGFLWVYIVSRVVKIIIAERGILWWPAEMVLLSAIFWNTREVSKQPVASIRAPLRCFILKYRWITVTSNHQHERSGDCLAQKSSSPVFGISTTVQVQEVTNIWKINSPIWKNPFFRGYGILSQGIAKISGIRDLTCIGVRSAVYF